MYVCMYVCMYVYMYVCTYIHVSMYVRMYSFSCRLRTMGGQISERGVGGMSGHWFAPHVHCYHTAVHYRNVCLFFFCLF